MALSVSLEYHGGDAITASVLGAEGVTGAHDWLLDVSNSNNNFSTYLQVPSGGANTTIAVTGISGITALTATPSNQLRSTLYRVDGDGNYYPYGVARVDYGEEGYVVNIAEWAFDGVDSITCTFTAEEGHEYYLWELDQFHVFPENTDPFPGPFSEGLTSLHLTLSSPVPAVTGMHCVLFSRVAVGAPADDVMDTRCFGFLEEWAGEGGNGFAPLEDDGVFLCAPGTDSMTATLHNQAQSNQYLFSAQAGSAGGANGQDAFATTDADGEASIVLSDIQSISADGSQGLTVVWKVLEGAYYDSVAAVRFDPGEVGTVPFPTEDVTWTYDGNDGLSADWTAVIGRSYYIWLGQPYNGYTISDDTPAVESTTAGHAEVIMDVFDPAHFNPGTHLLGILYQVTPSVEVVDAKVFSIGQPSSGHVGFDNLLVNGDGDCTGDGSGGGGGGGGGGGSGFGDGPFSDGPGTGVLEDEEMALTLGAFRTRAARAVGLSLTDAGDLDLMDDYINEACEQFLRLTKVHTRMAVMALTAGEGSYTLDTEIMSFTDAWLEPADGSRDVMLDITDSREISRMKRQTVTTSDVPRYIAMNGAHLLQIYPAPTSDEDLLHVLYVPRPAAMSTTADTPSMTAFGGIPSEFHPHLESYVKWKLGEHDENMSSKFGQIWKQQWDEGIGLSLKNINRKSGVFRGGITPGRKRFASNSPGVDSG